jgi:lysozyme family protein
VPGLSPGFLLGEVFMASENFESCLAITLKWEGGYSNHPDDPGGPTMRGIIQREYDAWLKKKGRAPSSVRNISDADVRAIYRTAYWNAMNCDGLAAGMDLCVFDAAVNSGTGRASKWLGQAQHIDDFCDARLHFLKGLGRLWHVFGAGWRRRVAAIRERAHLMASQSPPSQNPAAKSKSAPLAAHVQTPTGDITMTTATKPAMPAAAQPPASSGSWVSSIFSDIVNAAQTSFSTVWTAIAGMFGSASAGAAIVGILTHINPSWTAIAVGVLGILGTVLGAIASAYHLITHVSATNNATIALAEKWLNTAEAWFGQPPIDFGAENGDTTPASAHSAPAAATASVNS